MKLIKKGFTLVELVIVITVIGIIAAILIPTFTNIVDNANLATDKALIKNLNTSIAVEDILTGSSNDVLMLRDTIDEYGLDVNAKSDNLSIYFDTDSRQFFLGSIESNGLEVVYSTTKEINTNTKAKYVSHENMVVSLDSKVESNNVFEFETSILSPEKFIEGVWLISTSSSDKIANAIYNLRTPENSDDLLNSIESFKDYEDLYETIKTYVYTSCVVTEDGAISVPGATVNKVIFSDDVNEIKEDMFNNIDMENVQVIDIPNVESIDQDTLKNLQDSVEQKVVFTYPNETVKELLENELSKDDIVHINDKSNKTMKLKIGSDETEISIEYLGESLIFVKGTTNYNLIISTISSARQYMGSTNKNIAYDFIGWNFSTSDYITMEDGTIADCIDVNIDSIMIDKESLIKESDGVYKINLAATYNEVKAEVKHNSKYYTLVNALEYATSGQIELVSSAVLSTNATLNKDVELIIPYDTASNYEFDKSTDNYDKNAKRILPTNAIKPAGSYTINSNPSIFQIPTERTEPQYRLTIAKNVDFKCYGSVTVGAKFESHSGLGPSLYWTKYSEIVLEENAKLYTYKQLNCYGLISGKGSVEAISGDVLEVLTIEDHFGGSNMVALVQADVFPFNLYNIDKIQANINFYSQINYKLTSGATSSYGFMSLDFTFLSNTSDGVFQHNCTDKSKIVASKVMEENGKLRLSVKDQFIDNAINEKVSMSVVFSGDLDTSQIAFPLSNMDVVIEDNASMNLRYMYKLLPNSTMTNNGTLTIGDDSTNTSSMFMAYETFDRGDSHFVSKQANEYYASIGTSLPAKFYNNGTLNIESDASFAVGNVYTNNELVNNATIKVDSSAKVTNISKFKEGNGTKVDGDGCNILPSLKFTSVNYENNKVSTSLEILIGDNTSGTSIQSQNITSGIYHYVIETSRSYWSKD